MVVDGMHVWDLLSYGTVLLLLLKLYGKYESNNISVL